ncbi:MAG: hypothetical protein ACI9DF_004098 [Verrucomicrobiales bacterium]|jgi:hypothetical protein
MNQPAFCSSSAWLERGFRVQVQTVFSQSGILSVKWNATSCPDSESDRLPECETGNASSRPSLCFSCAWRPVSICKHSAGRECKEDALLGLGATNSVPDLQSETGSDTVCCERTKRERAIRPERKGKTRRGNWLNARPIKSNPEQIVVNLVMSEPIESTNSPFTEEGDSVSNSDVGG